MGGYRISEAAAIAGVSDDTVRRWIDQGRLRAVDGSSPTEVDASDLAALAKSLIQAPAADQSRRSSARNQFDGIVYAVTSDTVMTQVEIVCGPNRLVSLMSTEAAQDMGLEVGSRVTASVKSTNVVVEQPW